MFKFKVNDTVKITSGKDKNQTGKITKVFPKRGKVLVSGKNTYKKHIKPKANQKGQVVTLERPLPTSNIALICPNCNKPTRVGFEGKALAKVRLCKKCKKPITITQSKVKK